jgi:hypothetical protein
MLKRFWFTTHPGLGYGVTATSRSEAEVLLSSFGYPHESEKIVGVIEDIAIGDLDQNHVVPNAGPMVVFGVWFPNHSH